MGRTLLDAENNIEAGVFVLMGYARRVDSVHRALCWYNAGPRKERGRGGGMQGAVLKLYEEMEG